MNIYMDSTYKVLSRRSISSYGLRADLRLFYMTNYSDYLHVPRHIEELAS